ncbi:MAG TPA: prolyl oligopeptidase family serine peptidase [Polyangiaceae bacterium]|nr:prolyl oligopeptidase family serine peptidase [Polyangiaceae bacterium]
MRKTRERYGSSFGVLVCAGCAGAPAGVPLDFRVGDLQEYATVFAAPEVSGRKSPAVLVLHGGFDGDDDDTERIGRLLERSGVLAVAPTYRGEKRRLDDQTSDGRVEVCSGEVDDVQSLLRVVRARPDVDPDRLGLIGLSHGGCIALRAAERDPALRAVVSIAGPSELGYTERYLHARPFGWWGLASLIHARVKGAVGADAIEDPAAYRARSPLYGLDTLRQPLVLVQGTDDPIVPLAETCATREGLYERGRPVVDRYFKDDGTPDPMPKPRCPPLTGAPAASPPAGLPFEVWYFEGQGHGFTGGARASALGRAAAFLVRALTSP